MLTKPKTPRNLIARLSTMSDDALLRMRADLEVEMKRRRLAFSVGDIGEVLAIQFFKSTPGLPNLQAAPKGTKNVDALSRDGDRYSIKSIWNAKKTGTVYPDADNKDKQLFEFLLIVRLNDDLTLASIYQFTWAVFLNVRRWDKRMSAWYVPCSTTTLAQSTKVI